MRILEVNIYKMLSQRLARNKISCVLVTLVTVGYYHYYHNYSHILVACGSNAIIQVMCSAQCSHYLNIEIP